ncbi:short-chain fatty acid transporter [Caenimonas soli]|uniref:short-chain fatty acid transporter n=1 Tax=Caenimonas soli TaxID=2735555 RepID=UPI001F4616F5|nr:TIGR00366 family protein [Caenimonas soli]NPC56911.1 short-chain fatty acid transporter [Caenimonas soli]
MMKANIPASAATPDLRQREENKEQAPLLTRLGLRFTDWAERWFPDAFVFAALAVALIALAAFANGSAPQAVARAFGDGFWSLIVFSMQMALVAIGGYAVATSPPAAKLISRLAALPANGRSAVGWVACISMLLSLLNWGVSLIFSALYVRALARRTELGMDYRAAGAAAYLGLGATWALGLSSSAAQLQANASSLPKSILAITGVIPFSETIFLWQSMLMAAVLIAVSTLLAVWSAPVGAHAVSATKLGVDVMEPRVAPNAAPRRPGEWFEHSPLLTLVLVALGAGWLWLEFSSKSPMVAISALNTYNLLFLMLGLLLHWRPRNFLQAVAKAVPATTGVIIQFPLYGAIAAMMTAAKGDGGISLSDRIAHLFVSLSTTDTFAVVMGAYSALLGFFIPSGGGKWIIEAPYVMQAANELKVHLGWAVQVYNAAEALPNLINPFWMLPLLGVLALKARDIVGFTFLQLVVHVPLVLFMLWFLGRTLTYLPPVMP